MSNVAKEPVTSLFVGKEAIKTVMAGDVPVYERPGGYVYINLNSKSKNNPSTNQNEKE